MIWTLFPPGFLSELLPVIITYIINLSVSTSTVPYEISLALITTLLKKYCQLKEFIHVTCIRPVLRSFWWFYC